MSGSYDSSRPCTVLFDGSPHLGQRKARTSSSMLKVFHADAHYVAADGADLMVDKWVGLNGADQSAPTESFGCSMFHSRVSASARQRVAEAVGGSAPDGGTHRRARGLGHLTGQSRIRLPRTLQRRPRRNPHHRTTQLHLHLGHPGPTSANGSAPSAYARADLRSAHHPGRLHAHPQRDAHRQDHQITMDAVHDTLRFTRRADQAIDTV